MHATRFSTLFQISGSKCINTPVENLVFFNAVIDLVRTLKLSETAMFVVKNLLVSLL